MTAGVTKDLPKYYRITRYKQIRNVRFALVFEWSEKDPKIMVSFAGAETPWDAINVFNHEHETCTITDRAGFLAEVKEWMETISKESIIAGWENQA